MSPGMTKKYESKSEFAGVRVSSLDRMEAMIKRISLVIAALILNSMSGFGADTPPSLTLSPVSQIVSLGATAVLSVAATGTSLQYQWTCNGENIPGAIGTTLTL